MTAQNIAGSWPWFLVELIKALAWPIVVGIAAWKLTPLLASILGGRKVEVEAFGVKATVSAAERQQGASDNPAAQHLPQAGAAPPPIASRPALDMLEQRIRNDLVAYPQNDREAVLVRALAISRLVGAHEYIYNRIFGSQILGLKRLDEIGGTTVEQAREFFQPFASQYPDVYSKYGFDGWLGFMTSNGLVTRDDSRLEASAFGHEFLVYLREARLTELKPW